MDKLEKLIREYKLYQDKLVKDMEKIDQNSQLFSYYEGRFLLCNQIIRDLKRLGDENGIS